MWLDHEVLFHPGKRVEDGVAQEKAGKACSETSGDSEGNRVHEGSLVTERRTSIIEILLLRCYHLQRLVSDPNGGQGDKNVPKRGERTNQEQRIQECIKRVQKSSE